MELNFKSRELLHFYTVCVSHRRCTLGGKMATNWKRTRVRNSIEAASFDWNLLKTKINWWSPKVATSRFELLGELSHTHTRTAPADHIKRKIPPENYERELWARTMRVNSISWCPTHTPIGSQYTRGERLWISSHRAHKKSPGRIGCSTLVI